MEIKRKGNKQIIDKYSVIHLPQSMEDEQNNMANQEIYNRISQTLKESNYHVKKAVVVLKDTSVVTRNIVLSKYPYKVTAELLALRIEDYLLIDQKQYQVDFKVVKEVEDEQEIKNKILLVAMPNKIIDSLLQLLKRLRIKPIKITIPSETIENVFIGSHKLVEEDEVNLLVLDIGRSDTEAVLISEGNSILRRNIKFGVSNLLESSDNEKCQKTQSLSESGKVQIEYKLIMEIEKILDFYDSSHNSGRIGRIYLIGEGAAITEVQNYIGNAVNISTKSIEKFNSTVEIKDANFQEVSTLFANVLGAVSSM